MKADQESVSRISPQRSRRGFRRLPSPAIGTLPASASCGWLFSVSSVVKSFTVCRRSLLAGVLLAGLALGATSDGGARFSTLGHRLMCTCGCGQVLLECNHVGCRSSARMRSELLAAIQRGESDDQILNWFAAKYGPVVLAAPANRGFNRIAWLMPYAALLGGLTLAGAVLRRWRSRSQPAPLAGAAPRTSEKLEALRRKVHEETEI